ncbi:YbjN domain-containing protein [Gallibacterium trehalosifermentans]|uniref:YbjN domain-containing protein n=1 Tax=Gallibacterium trehalosifermentans TaxID=516935 RepID=A0ABV6GYW0_9PAST
MNKKAESFKAYLENAKVEAFAIEEIADDALNTVVFRSHFDIGGNQLPTIVILDDSIYAMIRVLIAPKVESEEAIAKVRVLLNDFNKQYKSFKYYLDDDNAIVLDTCLLTEGEAINGDLVYAMFEVLVNHLNDAYKEIMKSIWN